MTAPVTIRDTKIKPRPQAGEISLVNRSGRLGVLDSNGNEEDVALSDDNGTFDGEPTNYVAAVAAVASTLTTSMAGADNDLTVTAKVAGVEGDDLLFTLVDPGASLQPLTLSLDVSTPATPKAVVSLATGIGAAGVCIIPTTEAGTITVTLTEAGEAAGDAASITTLFALATDPFGADYIIPDAGLVVDGTDGTYTVALATDGGTVATLVATESSGSLGEITISQVAAYAGAWGNATVALQILTGVGESSPAACVATLNAATIDIALTLGTDAEGVIVALSDDDAAVLVNAALVTASLDGYLVCTSSTAGDFDSYMDVVAMGAAGGGVDGADPAPDDAANLASAIVHASTGLGSLDGIASAVASTGADTLALDAAWPFTGGGESAEITSTATEVAAAFTEGETGYDADVAALFACVVKSGDSGAGVVTALAEASLANGADLIPAVLGTPGRLGRLATDGTDVWTALVDDNTTTQAGWVKTFTA